MPKSSIAKSVVHELRFMLLLIAAIILTLGIGTAAPWLAGNQSSTKTSFQLTNPFAAQQAKLANFQAKDLTILEKSLFLAGIEPVVSQKPWLMTGEELTSQRVIYNVMTKPGFQILGIQLLITFFGIGLILRGARYVLTFPAKVYLNLKNRLGQLPADLNIHTIYGTVHITARSGVIYIAGTASALVHELEDFGHWLEAPTLRITRV